MTIRLIIVRKMSTLEYAVRYFQNNNYCEEKTYYTDDLEDAKETARAMAVEARNQGHKVIIKES